jgi:hypothetical protein
MRVAVAAGFSLLVGTAHAGPTDKIAEQSARFCAETDAGKRYPSAEACLDAQTEGAAIVQSALDRGHAHVPMGCLMIAKQEGGGEVDFAYAGRCVTKFLTE